MFGASLLEGNERFAERRQAWLAEAEKMKQPFIDTFLNDSGYLYDYVDGRYSSPDRAPQYGNRQSARPLAPRPSPAQRRARRCHPRTAHPQGTPHTLAQELRLPPALPGSPKNASWPCTTALHARGSWASMPRHTSRYSA